MEIRNVKLSDMKPAAYNPRKNLEPEDAEYKKLSNSIQEFGYVEPIIWNEQTGNIVGGHQRATILKNNGETEAEAVIVNLNEHDERILNVLLNRTKGEWDPGKLQSLMQELEDAGADISLTGFDEWELQGLINAYDDMDDILAFDSETGGPADEEPEDESEQEQGLEMEFQIPIEEKPAVDAYIDAYADAREELAVAVMDYIKGVTDNAD